MIYLVMGVWQGVAMDSLGFCLDRHAQPFHALRAGHPLNGLTAITGVARPAYRGLRPSSTLLDTPRCTPMYLI
jgi:hypothetical protein